MALATYADLVSAVGDWLDRDDLVPRIPTFVALVEAELGRELEDPSMEGFFQGVATGRYTPLPADYGSMIALHTGITPLRAITAARALDNDIAGVPRGYAIANNSITFYPVNSTAPFTMLYRRAIPALTAASPVNWLLTRAPDVYFYGVLTQASAFLVEDERAAGWRALYETALDSLRRDGAERRWGAGPIAPRINRP